MDTGPQKGVHINRYTQNIVSRARRMLVGNTDLELVGIALTNALEQAANNPATNPKALDIATRRLEDILTKFGDEIVQRNCQKQLGKLCCQYHSDAWVDTFIDTNMDDSDPLKQTLINILQKGENYEYDKQSISA